MAGSMGCGSISPRKDCMALRCHEYEYNEWRNLLGLVDLWKTLSSKILPYLSSCVRFRASKRAIPRQAKRPSSLSTLQSALYPHYTYPMVHIQTFLHLKISFRTYYIHLGGWMRAIAAFSRGMRSHETVLLTWHTTGTWPNCITIEGKFSLKTFCVISSFLQAADNSCEAFGVTHHNVQINHVPYTATSRPFELII